MYITCSKSSKSGFCAGFCSSPNSGEPGGGQRSATRRLRGALAEAAARGGGVWRRRHDPHCQEEAGCVAAAGPR